MTWPTSPHRASLLHTLMGLIAKACGEQRRTMAFYEAGGVDEMLQLVQQWRESSANPVRPPYWPKRCYALTLEQHLLTCICSYLPSL